MAVFFIYSGPLLFFFLSVEFKHALCAQPENQAYEIYV